MAGLVLPHQRQIGVLQTGPTDLEVPDRLAVAGEQVSDERGGVLGGVHEPLAVDRPAHLRLARDPVREGVDGVVGHDPAAGEDQDPVGQLLGLVEVMRGEQDRGVLQAGQPLHQLVELPARLGVEAGGRLVEEQQLRASDDADRHVEPAPLTARERRELAVRQLGQADGVEQQRRRRTAAAARAWSTARSSRRGAPAAGGASTWDGPATTGAHTRCGPASPRRRGPGPGPAP